MDHEKTPRSRPHGELAATLLHTELARFNRERSCPRLAFRTLVELKSAAEDAHNTHLVELEHMEHERAQVRADARTAPTLVVDFVKWFEALEQSGSGQHDPLFPWLAKHASRAQMIWFLTQEASGEAGFEDLVALTQVKVPTRAKLELARNYWDEMGRGHESGMHGPMLSHLCGALGVGTNETTIVWESLALGNLMGALAHNRCYAYQSIGALGAIELTAPGRAELVNAGLQRLGVSGTVRRYFALHATLDRKHAEAWNREVIATLVAEDPAHAYAIAEGALMRLNAGARCYQRYRRELEDMAAPMAEDQGASTSHVRSG